MSKVNESYDSTFSREMGSMRVKDDEEMIEYDIARIKFPNERKTDMIEAINEEISGQNSYFIKIIVDMVLKHIS